MTTLINKPIETPARSIIEKLNFFTALVLGVDPVMTMLEQKGEVKIIADTRTLKGTQDVFWRPDASRLPVCAD